jgi:hypothetical protein
MNRPEHETAPDPEPTAPARLAEDLRLLVDREIPVPAATDEAILGPARRTLGRRRTLRRLRWTGVAAALVLPARLRRSHRQPGPDRVAWREDVDANGRVDILDAFVLARRLRAGEPLDARWDVTGDGRVDAADVDRIARQAVRLDR